MHKKRVFVLINIFLSGLLAIVLYLLIRDDDYIIKVVSKLVVIENIRNNILSVNSNTFIGYIIKYSLGDLLWAYALNFSSYLGFGNLKNGVIISVITCFIIEMIQNTNYITGNFDIIDLFCMYIGIFISIIIIRRWELNVLYVDKSNEFI